MSPMNGNPHYQALGHHQDCGNALTPTVNATLALAFEQRTANLMQFLVDQDGDEARKLWAQVAARLGLNGDAS